MKKITFNVDSVLPQLAQVVSVVNNKNAIRILDSILVETFDNGNQILLTASDGELWLQEKASLVEGDTDVKFCIEAKILLQTLRGLVGRVVTLEFEDTSNVVKGSYGNGKFQLPFESADEYQKANEIGEEKEVKNLNATQFLNAIGMTEFAVSNDELRPQMNGVHFDFFQDKMVTAASDGHKLAKYSDFTITKEDSTVTGFTLSSKPSHLLVNILQKFDGDVKVQFNDRMLIVNNDSFRLVSRLIEGKFPNYDSVIPKDNDVIAIVNKSDVIDAMKRILPLGNSSSNMVAFDFEGKNLTLSSENIDFSTSASETISCEYNGNKFRIAFNGTFFIQSIQNITGDKIKMMMKDVSRAGVVCPIENTDNTEYISLIMPLMLKD